MPAEQDYLSLELSAQLDNIGFSRKRVRARIMSWMKRSQAKTISTRQILNNKNIEKFFVGSLREGTGVAGYSDTDIMQVNKSVICLDDVTDTDNETRIVFHLDRNNAPPGYTFLRHTNLGTNSCAYKRVIEFALIEKDGGQYFSSQLYMTLNEDVFCKSNGHIGRNTVYKERAGPSIPKYTNKNILLQIFKQLKCLNFDMDFVRGFKCSCPEILDRWCKRERLHGWPSKDMIRKVSSMDAHVVPVGQRGSTCEDLQWRICFTLGEVHLIETFNDTQTKMLVALKLIAKYLLAPECPEISSYMMKNIMFWIVEATPAEQFQEWHLLDRLYDNLEHLKSCIEKKELANYMIPERNLLEGKMTAEQSQQLLATLGNILEHGNENIKKLWECVESYMANENEPTSQVTEVLTQFGIANVLDTIHTNMLASVSTQQLANYLTVMYHCNSPVTQQLYHLYYTFFPYVLQHGWKGISDPMAIEPTETKESVQDTGPENNCTAPVKNSQSIQDKGQEENTEPAKSTSFQNKEDENKNKPEEGNEIVESRTEENGSEHAKANEPALKGIQGCNVNSEPFYIMLKQLKEQNLEYTLCLDPDSDDGERVDVYFFQDYAKQCLKTNAFVALLGIIGIIFLVLPPYYECRKSIRENSYIYCTQYMWNHFDISNIGCVLLVLFILYFFSYCVTMIKLKQKWHGLNFVKCRVNKASLYIHFPVTYKITVPT